MSAAYHILSDKSISTEEKLVRLQRINEELAESLRRLASFQGRIVTIKRSATVDEALDQMEMLLDEAVEFVYARLYLQDQRGEMQVIREMCPAETPLDWSLVKWACDNQEMAVIPLEEGEAGKDIKSVLLLPLAGHFRTLGILILWVAFDPSHFTQEQHALLTMLTRETAAVIETQRFRERIEQSRAVLQDVVESIPHGTLAIDANGCVSLLNSTIEFMLGIRRGDVLGQPYEASLPSSVVALLKRMMNKDNPVAEEQELAINLHGAEEMLGMTATPMRSEAEAESTGWVIVCRDLKMSREIAKLRELDAMKNDFLSLVSHELRTPITSIMAYSETMLMEGMVETEKERREYLQIINDEGARLARLVNDVLDLTKMEAGKLDYVYAEVAVNALIKTSISNSASLATPKNITLQTEEADDLPEVRMDSDRIMQVLMNLLSNAIKFTPEGGRVTIRTEATPPEKGQNIPTVTVTVADTGIGIAPENLNRVFSKFEQIEHIDHHSDGTGLGMPICKQIIEDGHGGRIWIESEVGKGTKVFFRIPVS